MERQTVRWEERRMRRRINLDFPVEVGVSRKRWHLPYFLSPHCSGVLQDASTEGLRICVDSEVEEASRLKVWIKAWGSGASKEVAVQGTVMWGRAADDGEHWVAGIQLGKRPRRGMQAWWDVVTEHLGLRVGTVALS